MPVFDFNQTPEKGTTPECTYTTFQSNEDKASPEKPILILDNQKCQWPHHSCGVFTNPVHRTCFEFKEEKTGSMYGFQEKTEQKVTAFTEFGRLPLEGERNCLRRTAFFNT